MRAKSSTNSGIIVRELSRKDKTEFNKLFLNPRRIARSAIIIKPSTLLKFHSALKKRKYRQLYSPRGGRKPGPKDRQGKSLMP